jgi:hypothetical protein
MDANTMLSTCILVGGIYGIFSFLPATGKHLFPSVYIEQNGHSARRYAILFTGIFCAIAGGYGLLVQPIF